MLDFDLASLHSGLVPVKNNLFSEEAVGQIKARLVNSSIQAQINASKVGDASKLASDTVQVYRDFKDMKQNLEQLQEQQEPWATKWRDLSQSYVDVTKLALTVDKKGISYFVDFNTKVISNIDWAGNNFKEAIELITRFLEGQAGPQLEKDSANVSQRYTENRRAVSEYRGNFSSFVDDMKSQSTRARQKLEGDTERLNAEIARYQSAGNQILRALRDIAGIPGWMTWLVSEILHGLGISSAEDARRLLDQNYAEQQRLNEQKASVLREMDRVSQLEAALTRAQSTLAILTEQTTDIYSRLDSFASEWAEYHHDIVLIHSDMQIAADSATQRSLIARLKLMGVSIGHLITAMTTYVEFVGGSGLFQ